MAAGPLLLALDTSTLQATVALLSGEEVIGEIERRVTTHSERLLMAVEELLARTNATLDDLDAIACGKGPGSFTGLRIGMATAKSLCWAMQKPLICVSSLAALARNVPAESRTVVPCVDARRGEVFAGFHGPHGEVAPEVVLVPEELRERLDGQEVLLVGDGALAYRDVFSAIDVAHQGHEVRAREVGRLALGRISREAFDDPRSAEPTYLRASDAEIGRRRR